MSRGYYLIRFTPKNFSIRFMIINDKNIMTSPIIAKVILFRAFSIPPLSPPEEIQAIPPLIIRKKQRREAAIRVIVIPHWTMSFMNEGPFPDGMPATGSRSYPPGVLSAINFIIYLNPGMLNILTVIIWRIAMEKMIRSIPVIAAIIPSLASFIFSGSP